MATALTWVKFERELGTFFLRSEKDYQHSPGNSQADSAGILGLP